MAGNGKYSVQLSDWSGFIFVGQNAIAKREIVGNNFCLYLTICRIYCSQKQQIVAAVVKGRKSVYWKRRKSRKRVSYIKPARKQLIILTNDIKWVMNYYDKNLYYIMYAASGIKLKMRKTHSFYRVQFSLLMHVRRAYVLVTTFYRGSEALPWTKAVSDTNYLRSWIRLGVL